MSDTFDTLRWARRSVTAPAPLHARLSPQPAVAAAVAESNLYNETHVPCDTTKDIASKPVSTIAIANPLLDASDAEDESYSVRYLRARLRGEIAHSERLRAENADYKMLNAGRLEENESLRLRNERLHCQIVQGKIAQQYDNGDMYKGEWKNGRHGVGVMEYADGATYSGHWRNDEFHGVGTMTCVNGDMYTGIYINGQCHGAGKLKYKSGDEYDGEWKNGEFYGTGAMVAKNGDKYNGEIKNGDRHGYGVMEHADGRTYKGEWANGKQHGVGVMWYDVKGIIHKYDGEWANGIQHGRCVIYYKNGNTYDGDCKNGLRDGNGIMIYVGHPNRLELRRYDGEWKNDVCHGVGVMYYRQDGTTYKGKWYNGKQLVECQVLPEKYDPSAGV